jgi:hypothetical protein
MLEDDSRLGQRWRMLTIFQIYPRTQAHIACTLVEEVVGDDRLLRSEMICALSLIREQMRLKAYLKHKIIPVRFLLPRIVINADASSKVFVYTFSGRKVRVVQVHFDGKHLVVRLTKYLDFMEEDVDNIKLLLRWMMNESIGGRTPEGIIIAATDESVKTARSRQGEARCHVRKHPIIERRDLKLRRRLRAYTDDAENRKVICIKLGNKRSKTLNATSQDWA